MHLHYHSCEVCNFTVPFRKHGEKGLQMCPCREAYYCGADHQKAHWKIHRQSCYTRKHKAPLSPFEVAVQHVLQFYDVSMVEIAVMALLKEDIEVDLQLELERKAVVLTLEPRCDEEEMADAIENGRIPPYKISTEVSVVSLELEARKRNLDHPFFEHPMDRQRRLARGELGVSLVFKPTDRTTTKNVPGGQLAVWQMIQSKEKTTTNPPMMYWQIMTANHQIRLDTRTKEEEMADKPRENQTSVFVEGILFPEDEPSPRMIKVKFDTRYNKGKIFQKSDFRPYLPNGGSIGCLRIDGPWVPQGDISVRMMIAIFYNERFLEDGSKPNTCIHHLTSGKTAHPWAGPFFAFRRTHSDTYDDAVMEQDLPVLVDFFASGKINK